MPRLQAGHLGISRLAPHSVRNGSKRHHRSYPPECALSTLSLIIKGEGTRMYSPSVNDIVEPYQHYPIAIQKAILLVETNPRFLGLTKGMKAVLKTLLTRASQDNGTQPIKARLDRVAVQANVSDKTVQRAMAALRDAGWVHQASEGRSEWGVFTYRLYRFTKELCDLVSLPTDSKKHRESEMSGGAVYVDLTFKEGHREILAQKRNQNPNPTPVNLPDELMPIVALGVKDTGVAKLRGAAYAKGHNLADIFVVASKRLSELKATGGRVYR